MNRLIYDNIFLVIMANGYIVVSECKKLIEKYKSTDFEEGDRFWTLFKDKKSYKKWYKLNNKLYKTVAEGISMKEAVNIAKKSVSKRKRTCTDSVINS